MHEQVDVGMRRSRRILATMSFADAEAVPADKASGRICAEQITPYPPGVPALVPGEVLNDAVIDYCGPR